MSLLPHFLCPLPWEGMAGDETERFCPRCQRSVQNLQALSMAQKLELLRTPRSDLCGRYRMAIRQAVPGREPCYFEHLLKYGAGVALAATAFITFWEVSSAAERASGSRRFHVGETFAAPIVAMPPELYEETSAMVLGMIACPPAIVPPPVNLGALPPRTLEIRLDDSELQKLLRMPSRIDPPALEPLRLGTTR